MRGRSLRRMQAAFVAALLAFATQGCDGGEQAARQKLSLVWISLDTLRADHVSLYGYARETTPFLDELAREGAWVEWAIAPQSATLPVHMTQFTGFHPVVHGVMHSAKNPGVRLRDDVRTLPEVLRDHGFRTRAWVDGGQMAGTFGFARGFESYDDRRRLFPAQLDLALEALDDVAADERFFFFVQTYEIHSPYAPPPPYRRRFVTPGERDRATRSMDLYDGSIRFTDDVLARFVARLDALGRLDDTVIVVTGDHGESFAEYGLEGIGHTQRLLRQNVTRVPWIVKHPSEAVRGRVIGEAGLEDFANTVLALLGIDERMPGQGRAIFDEPPTRGRAYVSWAGPKAWSVYQDGQHYLESELPGASRNGLFDVEADPGEHAPIEDPARVRAMAEVLAEARRSLLADADALQPGLRAGGDLSDELGAQLRALGYAVDPDADPEAEAEAEADADADESEQGERAAPAP